MRRYLLDTSVAGDFIFPPGKVFATIREHMLRGDRIGVGMPVVGELFAGGENSRTRERNYPRIERELRDLFVWPFDLPAAREFGRIFAYLRRVGRPIQQIDMQIAAIAITLGNCTLVTRDSDFAAIPELVTEEWR